jgi:hypothetical protein
MPKRRQIEEALTPMVLAERWVSRLAVRAVVAKRKAAVTALHETHADQSGQMKYETGKGIGTWRANQLSGRRT